MTDEYTETNTESDDLYGWSSDNPLPVQIIDPTSDSDSEEEIFLYDDYGNENEIIIDSVESYSNNSRSSSVADFKNLWQLKFNNQVVDVLFPQNASLEVVSGKLYNTGNSNVVGTVIDSSFSDSSFARYTITVLPVTNSNTQTQVYRNGSRIYLTSFSAGTQNNLVTTISYIQPTVEKRPFGWSLTPAQWIITGLLIVSILISIIGGLFRK